MGEVGGVHLVKLDRRRKNRRKGGGSLIEGEEEGEDRRKAHMNSTRFLFPLP